MILSVENKNSPDDRLCSHIDVNPGLSSRRVCFCTAVLCVSIRSEIAVAKAMQLDAEERDLLFVHVLAVGHAQHFLIGELGAGDGVGDGGTGGGRGGRGPSGAQPASWNSQHTS